MADQEDILHLIDDTGPEPQKAPGRKWKVAVIDDDHAVHEGTRFALSDYSLNGQTLDILSAYSAAVRTPFFFPNRVSSSATT